MSCLPKHGRVSCARCYEESNTVFDVTKRTDGDWRITANPLSWGSENPEIVVLGFSKGPTQAGALASAHHNEIAYKGSRENVGKILAHIGLIPRNPVGGKKQYIDRLIEDSNGRFHFGSLVRCTVERFDQKSSSWKGSGGGMLDKFIATDFGSAVATSCVSTFLRELPQKTRLIVMFGLGSNLNYVDSAFSVYQQARPGNWRKLNSVSYTDGVVTVVHVEHFASQGALIPNWLGENEHPRSTLGNLAKEAVAQSGLLVG